MSISWLPVSGSGLGFHSGMWPQHLRSSDRASGPPHTLALWFPDSRTSSPLLRIQVIRSGCLATQGSLPISRAMTLLRSAKPLLPCQVTYSQVPAF